MHPTLELKLDSSFLHPVELSNPSRVIAAALNHAKLEPPVFSDDAEVHPEDWLQVVNTQWVYMALEKLKLLP